MADEKEFPTEFDRRLAEQEREIAAMPAGQRAIMFIQNSMAVARTDRYMGAEARAQVLYTLSELLRQIERYEPREPTS